MIRSRQRRVISFADKLVRRARCILLAAVAPSCAMASGVSPYLPLNLSPSIERQIERILILADKPVMRRPIAAATVLDALPKACAIDAELCIEVRTYLTRYMRDAGIGALQATLAASGGDSDAAIPNRHGLSTDDSWSVHAAAFYQPNDYMLFNIGGIAYDGRVTPTGSLISLGFDFAQLDIGYRDHWLSPLTDSSMLIGTEAPTMASITLSNYRPISPLGLSYEVFLAEMSRQDDIVYFGSATSGKPRLAGLQAAIEPVSGYSLAVNRVMQYGGGARSTGGLSQFVDALLKNSNRPDVAGQTEEFGNQVASITSSVLFPGKAPFALRVEYAGEDNSYSGSYRLGDTALSIGIDFPQLWKRFDFSFETSEWQNVWYTHHIYPEGLTHHGNVLGHWFGDQRLFGDMLRGYSHTMQFGWRTDSGDDWRATYRTLGFQRSANYERDPPTQYRTLHELGLRYTTSWRGRALSAELSGGRDALGDSFARLAGTVDFAGSRQVAADQIGSTADMDAGVELFVDAGANVTRVYNLLSWLIPNYWSPTRAGYHVGVGARRPVSARNDLGARLEFDRVDGRGLLSIRALDYRYRFNRVLAAGAFFGVGRYDFGAATFGWYGGLGLQWTHVFPKWDLGADFRYYDKLSRNRVLADDPPITRERPRIHFDMRGCAFYLSRRF